MSNLRLDQTARKDWVGWSVLWRCADKLKDKKLTKQKRKLTPAEKAQKKKRQMEYMTIFMNGKQKRVKRPPTIDGINLDDFIQRNADPIWLHQNEIWEDMDSEGARGNRWWQVIMESNDCNLTEISI